MDKVGNVLLKTFEDFDIYKGIRLVIIVGGYLLVRNYVAREMAKKQLERQVRDDERMLSDNKKKNLVDDPETEKMAQSTQFGWGNKTRKRVKKQQEMLQKAIEQIKKEKKFAGEDSDEDIADLLED